MSKSVEERHSCGKGSGKINRPDDCIVVSSTPSTTTLSTSTDVAHKRIIETPKLRGMCATRSNMQKRTQVVASPLRVMEWEDIHYPKSRYDDSIGLKSGMGPVCGSVKTQGMWSATESALHINVLELQAANFAVQSFTKGKNNILQLDNTTVVAYLNKMGGGPDRNN